MKTNKLIRKIHHWTTVFLALPLLAIICSGLLLQVKKQLEWVQPPEQRGSAMMPQVEMQQVLDNLMATEDLGVSGWQDIDRLDVRPAKGILKAVLNNGHEVQVDLGTGQVLQTAYRRSDLIESIHDGSFFGGDWIKLGLFLPTGIALLLMWFTGLWLFVLPYLPKKRKRKVGMVI
ncbi:MAG TPA: PepSY-associated TM helix domain-containing protein [Xanthomonadales bacterium]|nr:PepSY-associated TM helix domain-containing protein [Xanthomonadales bacterium]